jgi:hypothetical protein
MDEISYDVILVNGFMIRDAMNRWNLKRDTANKQFPNSLYAFDDDEGNLAPEEVIRNYAEADEAYAQLQVIQQAYNAKITINYQDRKISLALGVKLIGGAGRIEKMWRSAIAEKRDRYSDGPPRERTKDSQYAKRQISPKEAMSGAEVAAKSAATLRSTIAKANGTDIDVRELGITVDVAKYFA